MNESINEQHNDNLYGTFAKTFSMPFFTMALFLNQEFFHSILKKNLMYRSSLSPYNSRATNYLDALERDETVNNLRREYAQHRTIQSEYDDLKYEINKAERENKKLEQKNCEVQEEYLAKIRANKATMTDLTEQIQSLQAKIESYSGSADQKQSHNEQMLKNLKNLKTQIDETENQNEQLERKLEQQENILGTLQKTLGDLFERKKQTQQSNKKDTEAVDGEIQTYKQLQEQLKNQQTTNAEMRAELEILMIKRAKLQCKSDGIKDKLKDLTSRLGNCENQRQKLGEKVKEIEAESAKMYGESVSLRQNISKSLTKNNDQTTRLKSLQIILKESTNGLCVKQLSKEKLMVHLSQLLKSIQKSQALIQNLNEQIEAQEDTNKGLIGNLKKSIQSDEQAVKTLTRKAAILNMIAQS